MFIFFIFLTVIFMFTFQTVSFKQFNRTLMKNGASYFLFSAVYYAGICALLFIAGFSASEFSPQVVRLAALFGASFICAMYFYMKAMENGPLGLSFLFFSAGMLAPIVFGIIRYGEPAPPHRAAGLLLLFAAFFVSARGDGGGKINKKWVVYILLGSLSNGTIGIAQKSFKNTGSGSIVGFLFLAFALAAGAALLAGLVLLSRGQRVSGFNSRTFAAVAAGAAITTAAGNFVMVYLSLHVSAMVQFPIVNGALVITSILASRLIFKEKITARHLQAIAVGLAAIVILSV